MKSLKNTVLALVLALAVLPGVSVFGQAGEAAKEESVSKEGVPDIETIVNKANRAAYYQGADGKAKVKMTITNKKGQTRLREFIVLRKDAVDGGDQKYFVYFLKPADVRKMVFMVHKHTAAGRDDDRWLYLPSLDLVRRIAAGDKRTSFVGSDFLYEDISGRGLDEDAHELIETTDKYYVVKNVPKKPKTVEFGYYTVSIDRKTFLPMKMEYYDRTGRLYRIIESKETRVIQGLATVVKSEVRNLNTGGKTQMQFTDVKYDINLKDIFTERYLRRAPREATR